MCTPLFQKLPYFENSPGCALWLEPYSKGHYNAGCHMTPHQQVKLFHYLFYRNVLNIIYILIIKEMYLFI